MSIVSGITGAVMGSKATKQAAETGAQAQREAMASQEKIYAQMRGDFEPYRQIGLLSLPYLQSAVLGGEVQSVAPGYSIITPDELNAMNQQATASSSQQAMPAANYNPAADSRPRYLVSGSRGLGNAVFSTNVPGAFPQTVAAPKYDTAKTWYRGPNGEITSTPAMSGVSFEPGQSPAAQYQLEKGNVALQRALASRGLAGGGYSASKAADLSKSVAADDWTNQYNRLLDLTKIGTGASGATGGAASTLSGAYGAGAANLGNLASQAGAAKSSLYSGLGAASANTVGTGLKLYDYGKTAGWWGSGSGAAAGASSAASAAETAAAAKAAAKYAV